MESISKKQLELILRRCNLEITSIQKLQSNGRVIDYIVDHQYILRLSHEQLQEIEKIGVIHQLDYVPKVYLSSRLEIDNQTVFFALISYVPGTELYSMIRESSDKTLLQIGQDIHAFLQQLHMTSSDTYDIGFYIPTIPSFNGTWKEGHLEYTKWLETNIKQVILIPELDVLVQQALLYIKENIHVLEYQTGPVYLHNDFHPKNIIISNQRLSGVIDFECAQYGERDFELAHLIHWSVFPPDNISTFDSMVQHIIQEFQTEKYVPDLDQRLTIYQLQHEINQLIWNPSNQKNRVERISAWLHHVIQTRFFT